MVATLRTVQVFGRGACIAAAAAAIGSSKGGKQRRLQRLQPGQVDMLQQLRQCTPPGTLPPCRPLPAPCGPDPAPAAAPPCRAPCLAWRSRCLLVVMPTAAPGRRRRRRRTLQRWGRGLCPAADVLQFAALHRQALALPSRLLLPVTCLPACQARCQGCHTACSACHATSSSLACGSP